MKLNYYNINFPKQIEWNNKWYDLAVYDKQIIQFFGLNQLIPSLEVSNWNSYLFLCDLTFQNFLFKCLDLHGTQVFFPAFHDQCSHRGATHIGRCPSPFLEHHSEIIFFIWCNFDDIYKTVTLNIRYIYSYQMSKYSEF